VGLAVCIQQARLIDQAAHELVYRQTTTRMETLGRLYHDLDPNSPLQEPPFGPGAAVAKTDPQTGWLLTGLIEQPLGPGLVQVAYTDESQRAERIADLTLLQSVPLSPVQMLLSLGQGLLSFLSGAPRAGDSSSLVWTGDAIAWDLLLVLGILGGWRARLAPREWLFPALVIVGTVAALVAVPGAPGNDDRHRASQTVPLLMVFAAGMLLSRSPAVPLEGRPVSSASRSPASASTLPASRTRSLR
jgi:hypothetical protein